VTGILAGLNGASLLVTNGGITLLPQNLPNTFTGPFFVALGATAQGDPMVDVDADGSLTETNETVVLTSPPVSDIGINRFGAGIGGASATVSNSGELILYLDTTIPGATSLTITPTTVLAGGAL
jgi:hypothetical protein